MTANEVLRILQITRPTLTKYVKEKRIKVTVKGNGRYDYDADSVYKMLNKDIERKTYIYARVSTTKQKEDLNRQIEMVKGYAISNGYKIEKIFKDIASGMNENRTEFNLLLRDVFNGNVDTVFVSYKDRLTRFGFDYFKHIIEEFGTKIVVLGELEETNSDFQTELTNDLISIIHHFSMKLYSNRRKKLKEIEKIIESKD